MKNDWHRYLNDGSSSSLGKQEYSVVSRQVEFPEGVVLKNSTGLLFDRSMLGELCPEVAWAVAGDLVATVFPDRRYVSLFSESRWKELRQILNKVPRDTLEQRTLRRLALGFETYIPRSEPIVITVTLKSYAKLTGDDLLVVKSRDYMELWPK
jgi:hypothetical protein